MMSVKYAPVPPALAASTAARPHDIRSRWTVIVLATIGAALFAASYFLPWWNFRMIAPQYPQGLDVQIALTGVTGAVAEVDILNHYVGMRSLSDAAEFERSISGRLVAMVVMVIALVLVAAGRKLGWLALIPAIGLPAGFLLDTMWWMHNFGHNLDPRAPIEFPEFTPTLIGAGNIAQFHTYGWPATGFWLAVVGLGLVVVAEVVRTRVCRACPDKGNCGVACPRVMVMPPREQKA